MPSDTRIMRISDYSPIDNIAAVFHDRHCLLWYASEKEDQDSLASFISSRGLAVLNFLVSFSERMHSTSDKIKWAELNHLRTVLTLMVEQRYQWFDSPRIPMSITVRFHRRAVVSDPTFEQEAGQMPWMSRTDGGCLRLCLHCATYFPVGQSPLLGQCPLLPEWCISYAYARLVYNRVVLLSPWSFIVSTY